jgi:hypothetical protein
MVVGCLGYAKAPDTSTYEGSIQRDSEDSPLGFVSISLA